MTPSSNARTSRELLRALRTPVARFYPCDLHVHSLGSYDVCQSGHFSTLPAELQRKASSEMHATEFPLPLTKIPIDVSTFDERVTTPELVMEFLKHLSDRRDIVAASAEMAESDNWCIIGITDHNTTAFSCELSQLAWNTRTTNRIIVIPGIELDVSFSVAGVADKCQIHILCLFAPCTRSSDIRLAINDSISPGPSSWSTGQFIDVNSLADFVDRLRSHHTYPALCIAAHVGSKKGVQREPTKLILAHLDAQIIRLEGEIARADSEGSTAEMIELRDRLTASQHQRQDSSSIHTEVLRIIGTCGFDALQVSDQSHETHYRRLHRFRDSQGRAVPIASSDAHSPSKVFSCASGVPFAKFSTPILASGSQANVFQELRARVLRFGETRMTYSSPGSVGYWIEGIEIYQDATSAKQFWKSDNEGNDVFTLELSRNLNCFVGGRGSGKSSGIEAIAFVTDPDPFTAEGTSRDKSDWYRRAHATLSGCRIRLVWKATGRNGIGSLPKKALIVSRYFDPDGHHEPLDVRDVDDNVVVDGVPLPHIRILRVHEIEETAKAENLRRLFDDLCGPEIDDLNQKIQTVHQNLVEQRRLIMEVVRKLHLLVAEGSPLRQYGIRQRQFEAVNKPEMQSRFEDVDKAATAGKCAAKTVISWQTLQFPQSIEAIESKFFDFVYDAHSSIPKSMDVAIPEAESLAAIMPAPHLEGISGHAVVQSLRVAKDAALEFTNSLEAAKESIASAYQSRKNELAKEGLPTGSSEREAKKRSFEKAVSDYSQYTVLVNDLDHALARRKALHELLVDGCCERTVLRTTCANEITTRLSKDLDPGVLKIVVIAKPMADKTQFDQWLQVNVEPTFSRYKNHRKSAILESGMLPAALRELLMHPDNPDLSSLRNSFERAEDGRIDELDAGRIFGKCRGRQRILLDESESWDSEFASTLPIDIRNGIVLFPSTDVGEEACIDRVLQLDEIVLDDVAEVRLNDRPHDALSEPRALEYLSPGQRCSAILPILLLSGDYPLVIDQPEENLDNRLIRQVIVNILASMKLRRQVIIATHNPNLPVLGDAEQCVVLQAKGRDKSTVVATGNLDSADVARYITDIMEGGREAFQYRQSIYQHHWTGPVDGARVDVGDAPNAQ